MAAVKGVTIYEVARAAGVSPSTVSNLLNGRPGRMLPATRLRVEQAIERLGYRPNRAAQQLRTGRIRVIGLVVPSVANPFWGAFARHLEGVALSEGYHLLLCNSERDPDRERQYIEELWDDGIRGVVLCSSLPSLDHLQPLIARGLGLVAFDRTSQAGDPASLVNVSVDNAVGASLATQHLLSLGHRRIALVSGSLASVNRAERLHGFQTAVRAARIPKRDVVVWSGASSQYGDLDAAELGRRAGHELMSARRPPTAIFAINDMTALGIYAGARDAGAHVPVDLSVIGFDDIVLADLAAPPLTTVRQSLPEMAAAAFGQLHELIKDSSPRPGRSILIRPELVVRKSTAPPPPAG
jgi:DNA-binding LacI/PurR family transcriptional regulator